MLRESLRKTFVYQFSLIAKREPPPTKRKGGHWGDSGSWQPRLWRPATDHKSGLAAVKHAQQEAERGKLVESFAVAIPLRKRYGGQEASTDKQDKARPAPRRAGASKVRHARHDFT